MPSIRGAVLLLTLTAGTAFAQKLPATQPLPALAPTSASPAASLRSNGRSATRAQVVYSEGQLSVAASNSSLNQILREISRQTGMKITGGVADERVFGKYGPASPSTVLALLLDGTGSNMFLQEDAQAGVAELILTPRQGGPTPPNPNAPGFDDDPVAPMEQPAQAQTPPIHPAQLPFSLPAVTPAVTSTEQTPVTPPPAGIVEAPTVAPATEPGTTPGPGTQSSGTSDPASANGVKTPQQIYEQLQKLQQQQAKPQQ